MGRIGIVVLVLVSVAAGLETLVRKLGPDENLEPARVWVEVDGLRLFAPDLDVWVASSRLQTEANGQRTALADPAEDADFSVLVVGGRFSAALGTDDEAHFAGALERSLREEFGVASARVRLWVGDGPIETRLEHLPEALDEHAPDCVVLQVQPEDFGVDPSPFVETEPSAEVWEAPWDASFALLRAASHWRERSDRRAAESRVAELIERDGLCSRATGIARQRFLEFQDQVAARPWENARLAAQMRESYDPERLRALSAHTRVLEAGFEQILRRGAQVLVMKVGPDELLEAARQACAGLDVPAVAGPPVHLDPSLRIGEPSRPADAVHQAWGRNLAAALEEASLLPPDREADEDEERHARALRREIRSFHGRHEGHQLEVRLAARGQVRSALDTSHGGLPSIFRGVCEDGRLEGSQLAFVVQGLGATDRLVVEVEAPREPPALRCAWWGGDEPGETQEAADFEPAGVGRWAASCLPPVAQTGARLWCIEATWQGEPVGRLLGLRFQRSSSSEPDED